VICGYTGVGYGIIIFEVWRQALAQSDPDPGHLDEPSHVLIYGLGRPLSGRFVVHDVWFARESSEVRGRRILLDRRRYRGVEIRNIQRVLGEGAQDRMSTRIWIYDAESVFTTTVTKCRGRKVGTMAMGASLDPSSGRLVPIVVHSNEFVQTIRERRGHPHRTIS
jgi:hypothetical protein